MLTLIGDVHGLVDRYYKIARKAEYTLQVGDFGFWNSWNWLETSGLDHTRHKILCGNHDVPPHLTQSLYSLGHYGIATLGGISFFYLRGAESIDAAHRVEGVSWWREEQLSYADLSAAFDAYCEAKPKIVITHEAPAYLKMMLCGQAPDRTSNALDQFWMTHKPQLWIHGHHHKSQRITLLGTHFVSLAELEVFKL